MFGSTGGGSITPKTFTIAAISLGLAAIFTIIGTTTQGYLWEVPNVRAQEKIADAEKAKAEAEIMKAKAQIAMAEAEKAKAEAEKAKAVAELEKARAQHREATAKQTEADAYRREVGVREVEVEATDKLMNKQIVQPLERMSKLENEVLSLEEQLDAAATEKDRLRIHGQIQARRAAIEREKKSAARAMTNTFGMITAAMAEIVPSFSSSFVPAQGGERKKSPMLRRIEEEEDTPKTEGVQK